MKNLNEKNGSFILQTHSNKVGTLGTEVYIFRTNSTYRTESELMRYSDLTN